MWGLETIREMNADAAKVARRERVMPYYLDSIAEVEAMAEDELFPIPFLGDACEDWDADWDRLDDLFVDSSGFGQEGEPALTARQFKQKLLGLIQEHGGIYVAVCEAGQFQVYIAVWASR